MAKQMSLEEFVGHRTRDFGGAKFLTNWKKREPPKIDVVLHTKVKMIASWQHNKPRIVERKDKTGVVRSEIWGGSFNCCENEVVLKAQHRRSRESGEREVPPIICPDCRLIEFVRGEVNAGRLSITAPVLRYVAGEGENRNVREITAGGMYGGFYKDSPPAVLDAMRKAGLRLDKVWQENQCARCCYVFVIVDLDNVGDGVQVSTERQLLGDKMKAHLGERIEQFGVQGNPFLHPVAFRWKHKPNEVAFGDKYQALAMPTLPLSDEVLRLINEEPPDLTHILKPGNAARLRTELESVALIKVPWDDIFGPAERLEREEAAAATDADEWADDEAVPEVRAAPSAPGAAQKITQLADDPITCDICDAVMRLDEFTCPKCGQLYDELGSLINDPPPPPPPPVKRKRSGVAKAAATAPAIAQPATKGRVKSAAKASKIEDDLPDDFGEVFGDDSIPF